MNTTLNHTDSFVTSPQTRLSKRERRIAIAKRRVDDLKGAKDRIRFVWIRPDYRIQRISECGFNGVIIIAERCIEIATRFEDGDPSVDEMKMAQWAEAAMEELCFWNPWCYNVPLEIEACLFAAQACCKC
jgi:hypothetical protein